MVTDTVDAISAIPQYSIENFSQIFSPTNHEMKKFLGFDGFAGKTVVDIGTRDGRNVSMIKNYGAREVFGIDPNETELQQAIDMGILDNQHAIPRRLEEVVGQFRGKINVACIFQFNIPVDERENFLRAVNDILTEDGQVIVSLSDKEILNDLLQSLKQHFSDVKRFRPWGRKHDFPHSFIFSGRKKRFS